MWSVHLAAANSNAHALADRSANRVAVGGTHEHNFLDNHFIYYHIDGYHIDNDIFDCHIVDYEHIYHHGVHSYCHRHWHGYFGNGHDPNGHGGQSLFLQQYGTSHDCDRAVHLVLYDRWGCTIHGGSRSVNTNSINDDGNNSYIAHCGQ
jgi:hypothetical protein